MLFLLCLLTLHSGSLFAVSQEKCFLLHCEASTSLIVISACSAWISNGNSMHIHVAGVSSVLGVAAAPRTDQSLPVAHPDNVEEGLEGEWCCVTPVILAWFTQLFVRPYVGLVGLLVVRVCNGFSFMCLVVGVCMYVSLTDVAELSIYILSILQVDFAFSCRVFECKTLFWKSNWNPSKSFASTHCVYLTPV